MPNGSPHPGRSTDDMPFIREQAVQPKPPGLNVSANMHLGIEASHGRHHDVCAIGWMLACRSPTQAAAPASFNAAQLASRLAEAIDEFCQLAVEALGRFPEWRMADIVIPGLAGMPDLCRSQLCRKG